MPQVEGGDLLSRITLKGFLVQSRALEAMPLLSMVSKATFSTGGCVLDAFCSFLTSSMVEARLCAQDWLRSAPLSLSIED